MPITSYPGWVDKLRMNDALKGTIDAYNSVPMLYRAVNLRCDAISTVPYTLHRGEDEAEWPWRQDLAQLIKETERHLLLTGGAFWLKLRRGNVLTGFQLLNPTTMTVDFDRTKATPSNIMQGVIFKQSVGGTSYGPWTIEDIVYFREPSLLDEVRPGVAPASVALQSAQLGHYLERFASHFFEGGAQPITVLNLPESMDESEFKRFQTEWTARFTGVINAFRTAFVRAPDLKISTITPPLNELMMPELSERVITSVSMTLGVPRTMLEASAANYATADSDRQSFWRETIVPRLSLYDQVLNAQLLEALNYQLRFQPEALDVLQADEANRAGSLLQLVQAGVPLRGAMTILGYDLIDEALGPEPEPTPPTTPEPTPPEPSAAPPDDMTAAAEGADDNTAVASLRAEHWELIAKKLERRIKAGKALKCTFESDVLTADDIASVMERLEDGMTVAQMKAVVDEVKAEDMTPEEREIFNRIIDGLTKKGERWARKIYRGEDVPEAEGKVSDVVGPVLNDRLGMVMGGRIDRLGVQFQPIDPTEASDIVQDWLVEYIPERNRQLDASTISVLKKAIAAYRTTPGMTIQDVMRKVAPATDRARARSIAITEVTRAASQAQVDYQRYLSGKGIAMERTWVTNLDELVCPTCGPLHNMVEDEPSSTYPQGWIMEYPEGPPAHVNCRCSTALTVVKP